MAGLIALLVETRKVFSPLIDGDDALYLVVLT